MGRLRLLVVISLAGVAHSFVTAPEQVQSRGHIRGSRGSRCPAGGLHGDCSADRWRHSPGAAPQGSAAREVAGFLLGLVAAACVVLAPAAVHADAPGKWNYQNPDVKWPAGFAACSGKEQSPIDIRIGQSDTNVILRGSTPEPLANFLSYSPTGDLNIFNNGGKNVQVNGGFGTFSLPDGVYEAKQFHFHFPSEHSINGKLYAGELHIVHQRRGASGTNGLAVVGILLDEKTARSDGPIQFLDNLGFGRELPDTAGDKESLKPVDLTKYAANYAGPYYHYEGSLTTPPCSEKVHWYVLEKPAPCPQEMTQTFRKLFPENNRPVQPLGRRQLVKSLVGVPGEFVDPKKPRPSGFRVLAVRDR